MSTIPFDKMHHGFFDRNVRGVAQVFTECGSVGPSAGDIAGLDGNFADLRFFLQRMLEGAYQVEDGDRVAVADVVDAGGGGETPDWRPSQSGAPWGGWSITRNTASTTSSM